MKTIGASVEHRLAAICKHLRQWAGRNNLFKTFVSIAAVAVVFSGDACLLWPQLRLPLRVCHRIHRAFDSAGLDGLQCLELRGERFRFKHPIRIVKEESVQLFKC